MPLVFIFLYIKSLCLQWLIMLSINNSHLCVMEKLCEVYSVKISTSSVSIKYPCVGRVSELCYHSNFLKRQK